MNATHPQLAYRADGREEQARWWSELAPAPARLAVADDRTTAEIALRRAAAGEGLVYRGDWHNARQLLAAMGRRLRTPRPAGTDAAALYRAERERRRLEHEVLSRLAVPLGPGWASPLRRAPPLEVVLSAAFGAPPGGPALLPLREVLGAIGAHEWLRRGVPVPALGGAVHPSYGVFAPVRGEYVELVARALADRPPPKGALAFDVGTGTGVLALLLARAGARVVATDLDPRAVACARDSARRFGLEASIEVLEADLFPPGRARLVVANPPWLPGTPHGALDRAVYDPGGAVLSRLVAGLREHLAPDGEAWLVLSDLAERLGLRAPGELERAFGAAGLTVRFTLETRPGHPRARGGGDALARALAEERRGSTASAPADLPRPARWAP